MKKRNHHALIQSLTPKKAEFDPAPFISLAMGVVAVSAFCLLICAKAVSWNPPQPQEAPISYADRADQVDTTTDGQELTLDVEEATKFLKIERPASSKPIAFNPCRGCGESRYITDEKWPPDFGEKHLRRAGIR